MKSPLKLFISCSPPCPPKHSELEGDANRPAPEVKAPQTEINTSIGIRMLERTEGPDVTTDTDVAVHESHDAAADVESEIVAGRVAKKPFHVANARPDQTDAS